MSRHIAEPYCRPRMAYRPPYIFFCGYSVTEAERAPCNNEQLVAAGQASKIPSVSHVSSSRVLHSVRPESRPDPAGPQSTCNPDECSITPCHRAPRPNQPCASKCLYFVPREPQTD